MPRNEGCKSSIERFYFDKEKNLCAPFVYTGCGINGNNFATLKECNQVCRKYIPGSIADRSKSTTQDQGKELLLKTQYLRYQFSTGRSKPIGPKVPEDDQTPKRNGICFLPIASGPCHDRQLNYAFVAVKLNDSVCFIRRSEFNF